MIRLSVGEEGRGEPVVQLFDPAGNVVASDSGSVSATIQLDVSATGTYTAIVSDGGNDEAMSYRIRGLVLPGSPALIDGRDASLTSGQEIESFIPLSRCRTWIATTPLG